MDRKKPDSDMLLNTISNQAAENSQGHLKIFFGYAAGVGKTYAMLQAAHVAKNQGIDVVTGYIEPHHPPQTQALLAGLEQIRPQKVQYRSLLLSEFDLDAALKRRPQLILVDEFAHKNAPGMRHAKRYQDIKELLAAGIDVYTTVTVQEIERLSDTVSAITGTMVEERIPDEIFDKADQVEFVDIEPSELIERIKRNSTYENKQADNKIEPCFMMEHLTALREIALRRCADRISIQSENARTANGDFHTDEHVLVCLSAAPSNQKIIRTAARLADAFKGTLTALYVETPAFAAADEAEKKKVQQNMRLAKQLGANIETVYGDDVPYQIAEFARLSGVSKVVIGQSAATNRRLFSKPSLTEKLIADAPNMDIHIIPDSADRSDSKKPKNINQGTYPFSLKELLISISMLLAATVIGFGFSSLGFTEANIITVYILAVLMISVLTTRRVYSLISSVVSVLAFNFFFTVPRFTFVANDIGSPATFVIMFTAAFITSTLAIKLKNHAKQAAQAAFRTTILLDTNQLMQKAKSPGEIITATANQLIKLLGRNIVFYHCENGELDNPRCFWAEKKAERHNLTSEKERAAAQWVMKNNRHAGATTDTLSEVSCLYLAVRVNPNVYGVVGIEMDDRPMDAFENSVLLSILGECALALENEKNLREKEAAAIMAKNEQLRANLLRTISHDLRTPLTSIMGNADNLLSNGDSFDSVTKQGIYKDIYDDSMWLINLVENLLSVTRLEAGKMKLNRSVELMEEIIQEALNHVNNKSGKHLLSFREPSELVLVNADARLMVQVIVNLVDNAVKYTPDGSEIHIELKKEQGNAVVTVSDNGPGIPEENKGKIFDMFFCGSHTVADSRRSMGLGLALCKSIVAAHDGDISVSDNIPHGAVFTLTLPAKEVNINE